MANRFDKVEDRMRFNMAEKYFEYVMHKREMEYFKYGLDDGCNKLDRFVRNTPDYIVKKGKTSIPFFTEVKGCGEIARIKVKDFEEYKKWAKIMPLTYFFYSTHYNDYKWVQHTEIALLEPELNDQNFYPPDYEGGPNKYYYEILWSMMK
tara:strand:- start:15 stop:464 length:450 start_codon:yes stop_codon:yes gene_type:complete